MAKKKVKRRKKKKSAHSTSGNTFSPVKWFWWIAAIFLAVVAISMIMGVLEGR
jgi:hypothetical protein